MTSSGSGPVGARWDSTDTIILSGYDATTSGPTISFTTQVKILGGDCLKSVTSFCNMGNKIDEKTSISVTSAVGVDGELILFGGTSFAFGF